MLSPCSAHRDLNFLFFASLTSIERCTIDDDLWFCCFKVFLYRGSPGMIGFVFVSPVVQHRSASFSLS